MYHTVSRQAKYLPGVPELRVERIAQNMVSVRSGPVEMISIGTPVSFQYA